MKLKIHQIICRGRIIANELNSALVLSVLKIINSHRITTV
jgi:hypothetical protein